MAQRWIGHGVTVCFLIDEIAPAADGLPPAPAKARRGPPAPETAACARGKRPTRRIRPPARRHRWPCRPRARRRSSIDHPCTCPTRRSHSKAAHPPAPRARRPGQDRWSCPREGRAAFPFHCQKHAQKHPQGDEHAVVSQGKIPDHQRVPRPFHHNFASPCSRHYNDFVQLMSRVSGCILPSKRL